MCRRKKVHYKVLLGGLLGCALCVCASGCSAQISAVRLTQRIILQSTGVDVQNGTVTLSGNAFIATQNNGDGETVCLLGQGRSVSEAASDMANATGGAPYFSHNRAVVIGRQTAEAGIRTLMDFFAAYRECRGTALLYVCEGDAAEMIRRAGEDKAMTSGLDEPARIAAQGGNAPDTAVWQAAQALSDVGRDFVLPYLTVQNDTVAVSGCAVFADDRMVCVMNEDETRGLLLMRNAVFHCLMTVYAAESGPVTLEATSLRCTTTVDRKSTVAHFSVALSADCRILSGADAASVNRAELEALCGDTLTEWMQSAVRKAFRQNRSDPFSFGRLLRRSCAVRTLGETDFSSACDIPCVFEISARCSMKKA